jgi:hypothetical protein
MTKLVPVVYEKPAKNPIFFPAILIALQAIFIVLLALHADYGHEPEPANDTALMEKISHSMRASPSGSIYIAYHNETVHHRGINDFYSMFQDIHIMIFIGFGFLMTFLKRYG